MSAFGTLVLGSLMFVTGANEPGPELSPELKSKADGLMQKAVEYYRSVQAEDGSFGEGDYAPAMTALAITGILRSGQTPITDPAVLKGLAFLEKFVQKDGGIYVAGSNNRNYPTAIALLAFAQANKDHRYDDVIKKAAEYLKSDQWDEKEGIDPSSPKYGGTGYGGPSKTRPDLSNTAYFLEALEAAGVPKDDPAYKRALLFVTRCQNLSGEGANDLPAAKLIDDGGFYYTPAQADYNPAGFDANGGLRSYGSMTYAGLKSFIHAGLNKDDRRVKAAEEWIKKHYTLLENPGMGQAGLYYYYHTFAKALDILAVEEFQAADGASHDWRKDLINVLAEKQAKDGSWTNPEKRWMESDGRLTTAYGLLALSHATK